MADGLIITETDYKQLRSLLSAMKANHIRDNMSLCKLHDSLSKARIVIPTDIPEDMVTMNSRILVRDPETKEEATYTLVYPKKSDYRKGYISILAPLGAALIGSRTGDTVSWMVPKGERRLEIMEIRYQPEANRGMHA